MEKKKRFEVRAECPLCGCGSVSHLSEEEIRAKTIDGEHLELTCPECLELHRAIVRVVCPKYSTKCHL